MTEQDLKYQDLKREHEALKEENERLRVSNSLLKKELQQYRDLEGQSLLLKLPCKEGDTVYTVSSYMECCREECKWLEEECDECWDYQRVYFVKETNFQIQMIALFGKTVFHTKEEAEAKLEELKDDGFKKGI